MLMRFVLYFRKYFVKRYKNYYHIPILKVGSAVSICLLLLGTGLIAQGPAYRAPRTPDGKPDLNGIWQVLDTAANWDIEGHAAEAGPVREMGAVYAVPPGLGIIEGGDTIPYLPGALEQRKKNYDNRKTEDPEARCYLPGVPRATYMPYPFQILQTAKVISIAYEYDDATRMIDMGNPGEAPADSWMGWSKGRWEGDTLVVDVTALTDGSWLDRAGDYHSNDLHVIERYTRTGPVTMNYEATLEDPQVYSKPFKISLTLYKHVEKNAQLLEFKCVPFGEPVIYGPLERKSSGN